ncbi:MAG TPA: formate dehydrogenase accessory sulfurtransferase FdhD [Longimicrobiales bacterium]|nr:formate dehydrogenase accessory sulfurtransferase FdhD [Longimicrobiales bacterium]
MGDPHRSPESDHRRSTGRPRRAAGRAVDAVGETVLRIEVDGGATRTLTASAGEPADLAVGHLLALGYDARALRAARIACSPGVVRVALPDGRGNAPVGEHDGGAAHVIACEACAARLVRGRAAPPGPEALRALMTALLDGNAGVHGAALVRGDEIVHRVEDVGRHAAVDRLVGAALRRGWDARELGLATTARISGDIAYKAARAGLAWIASRSVPTTLALEIAALVDLPIAARAGSARARLFRP